MSEERERIAKLEARADALEAEMLRQREARHEHANRLHAMGGTVEVLRGSVEAIRADVATIRDSLVAVIRRLDRLDWRTTGAVSAAVVVIEILARTLFHA